MIPLPAVIMSLSIEKHQYRISSSTACLPSADMWFHSTTLVFTILLGAGICFLIIIFFIIHRVSIISNASLNITCFIAIHDAQQFNDTVFLCHIIIMYVQVSLRKCPIVQQKSGKVGCNSINITKGIWGGILPQENV